MAVSSATMIVAYLIWGRMIDRGSSIRLTLLNTVVTLLIPIGSLLGHFYEKWAARTSNAEFAQRMGVLLATGLIVGESLFGVLLAAIVVGSGNAQPLAIMGEWFEPYAVAGSIILFPLLSLWLYGRSARLAARSEGLADSATSPR